MVIKGSEVEKKEKEQEGPRVYMVSVGDPDGQSPDDAIPRRA